MFNFSTPTFEMPTAAKFAESSRQYSDSVLSAITHKETKDAAKKVSDFMLTMIELSADQYDRAVGTFTSMFGTSK